MSHRRLSLLLFLLILLCAGDQASARSENEVDLTPKTHTTQTEHLSAAEQQLIDAINEATQEATKERINADWVPGMFSVLRGSDLELRGVTTVREALTLLPGVAPVSFLKGELMFRGVAPDISLKVKIMVDGVTETDFAIAGLGTPVLNMPIAMVERIDVIRGPGSALYGGNAFSGVINVITRKNEQRIYTHLDAFNTRAAGVLLSHQDEEWQASINLSRRLYEGDDIVSSKDALFNTPLRGISPGPVNQSSDFKAALFNFKSDDIEITGQYTHRGFTVPFGVSDILPPDRGEPVHFINRYTVELKKNWSIGKHFDLTGKTGWYKLYWNIRDEYLLQIPPPGNLLFGDWATVSSGLTESRLYGSLDFDWQLTTKHRLSGGLEYSVDEVDDSWFTTNIPVSLITPGSDLDGSSGINLVSPGANRKVLAVTLQDQYQINDHLTLTAGFRYDSYNDLGDRLEPRLALVYQLDERHVFKAQYGSAFRPPSAIELYLNEIGNNDAASETIQTWELGYIFTSADQVVRLTGFYSEAEDLIELDGLFNSGSQSFINIPGTDVFGLEAEYEIKLSEQWKIDSNVSWLNTESVETQSDFEGAVDWLGNAAVIYQPSLKQAIALQYQFVGNRHREVGDLRPPSSSSSMFNLTGTLKHFPMPGGKLQLSIKNLFNKDLRLPAPKQTYEEDYPQDGRNISLTWTYDF